MELLEVLGEDMVGHLRLWDRHGDSLAIQWNALLEDSVTATDHLLVAGQEMGRGILDLVDCHLQDTKEGLLTTISGGIDLTILMKILEIVASLTGHHHQSGDQETMDGTSFWIGKGMIGDHHLHLHPSHHHLVDVGLIVTREREAALLP